MKDAEVEQKLRSAGVPDAVIRYALKQGGRWESIYFTLLFILMVVFLSGTFLGISQWFWLEKLTEINAIKHAGDTGALMYYVDFGLSPIIGLFAWIFVTGALVGSFCFISRRWLAASFLSMAYEDETGTTEYVNQRFIRKLRNEKDPERYIRRVALGWLRISAIAGASLSVIGAVAVLREVQVHSIFTPQAYIRVPFLPWPSPAHDWSSATSVGTGCSYSQRENSGTPRYEVTFSDGASVDLGYAKPVAGDWLSAVEAIDREVRKSGATFSPRGSPGDESFHPRCIEGLRAHFRGRYFDRMKRLLRLPT